MGKSIGIFIASLLVLTLMAFTRFTGLTRVYSISRMPRGIDRELTCAEDHITFEAQVRYLRIN